jgi:hypothetical protein
MNARSLMYRLGGETMQIKEVPFTLRLGTLNEYHKMAEAGIFHPEERVELIASKVYFMID